MSNIVIDIAAQFTGKPAFKKADTAVDQLNRRTQNLGKTLTRTFGTAAIVAFGRASVKAFAEDDKAATSLGQTLKNLNLAYGSNIGTVNGYISRLEAQTGVLDDELRPAMDRLLRATGDVGKSQELLNLALDVAAGTGKSVTQVSQSLQKAYLGQTQALGRLGVGLSKADLASSSFEEIQQKLTTLFAGQATAAAETFAGQLDKLTIAANNAKETIGKGLFDGISALSGNGITGATDNIDKLAKGIGDSLANAGELIGKLEKLKPVLIAVGLVAAAAFLPLTTAIAGAIWLMGDLNKRLDEQSFRKGVQAKPFSTPMSISSQDTQRADAAAAKKAAAAQLKLMKEQAAAQAKILRDKRLGIAIDKASLLLGKGSDVFDMDKIQNQAALINQADMLAKTTNASQILQITNDTARLNVKKAISDLEDAIAAKDEAAIIAATKKLNIELATFNAISQQNIKLTDVKTVLDSLKAKDLINIDNLNTAIAKLIEIGKLGIPGSTTTSITTDAAATAAAILAARTEEQKKAAEAAAAAKAAADAALAAAKAQSDAEKKALQDIADALLEAAEAAAAAADAASTTANATKDAVAEVPKILGDSSNATDALGGIGSTIGSNLVETTLPAIVSTIIQPNGREWSSSFSPNITVNTGIGDPNAIAEAIDQVLREARDRGTLTAL